MPRTHSLRARIFCSSWLGYCVLRCSSGNAGGSTSNSSGATANSSLSPSRVRSTPVPVHVYVPAFHPATPVPDPAPLASPAISLQSPDPAINPITPALTGNSSLTSVEQNVPGTTAFAAKFGIQSSWQTLLAYLLIAIGSASFVYMLYLLFQQIRPPRQYIAAG